MLRPSPLARTYRVAWRWLHSRQAGQQGAAMRASSRLVARCCSWATAWATEPAGPSSAHPCCSYRALERACGAALRTASTAASSRSSEAPLPLWPSVPDERGTHTALQPPPPSANTWRPGRRDAPSSASPSSSSPGPSLRLDSHDPPAPVASTSGRAAVLDGRAVAAAWTAELAIEAQQLSRILGRRPGLGVVVVGDRPDSALYVAKKQEACIRVGAWQAAAPGSQRGAAGCESPPTAQHSTCRHTHIAMPIAHKCMPSMMRVGLTLAATKALYCLPPPASLRPCPPQAGFRAFVHRLPADVSQEALEAAVADVCASPDVDGVLIQLPLPRHLSEDAAMESLDPRCGGQGARTGCWLNGGLLDLATQGCCCVWVAGLTVQSAPCCCVNSTRGCCRGWLPRKRAQQQEGH